MKDSKSKILKMKRRSVLDLTIIMENMLSNQALRGAHLALEEQHFGTRLTNTYLTQKDQKDSVQKVICNIF